MTNRPKPDKQTVAYYMPTEVRDWIDSNAEAENRSPSNFLSTLIQRLMAKEKPNAPR